ncbi:hypothetical protein [Entomospira culicis]|uniref:SPOR domain-containing protein n=1 Tax=Entomospira culicis TaxID=2719989 RepID=A0A968KW24_9SPIO|nr:hypothetical protein [Entomospira culicis]NIZ18506.1 hypothetical protein [Entomospira culicis]NIZ68722.1 hypothetical protein [Entomospira culicis]WDI37319.1 hypothetical protein PVA46_00585 [Entomospira culicis]WDI38948.1 hypothetical protein PVA47_00595 [Entomospira culicis]
MQINVEWVHIKHYLALLGLGFLLFGGFMVLSGQSQEEEASFYPRFVVARLASFDFFGEPEIEVIIEDAEARPPAGSDEVIDPNEVIDEIEEETKDRTSDEGNPSTDDTIEDTTPDAVDPPIENPLTEDTTTPPVTPPVENPPLPDKNNADAVVRDNPQERTMTGSRWFTEGDRTNTEERVRSWSRNPGPRPIPDEGDDKSGDTGATDTENSTPTDEHSDDGSLPSAEANGAPQRSDPNSVALITLVPSPATGDSSDEEWEYDIIDGPHLDGVDGTGEDLLPSGSDKPKDDWHPVDGPHLDGVDGTGEDLLPSGSDKPKDDWHPVDGPHLDGVDGKDEDLLPSGSGKPKDDWHPVDGPHLDGVDGKDEDILPSGSDKPKDPITPDPKPILDNPWSTLPLIDQQFLAPYWQAELEEGFYIQVFATIQPLKLRAQIERHRANLPLVITGTYGRLGMMNRLLVGPLKADELGAVEHQLRLNGVRDSFLVSVKSQRS